MGGWVCGFWRFAASRVDPGRGKRIVRTRLSVFCDKVIEAGWLTAVVVVPLFFNIYSQRVFEPDKLSLLRSIALVMAVAWVVKFA